MFSRMNLWTIVGIALSSMPSHAAAPDTAADVFKRLGSLVGTWEGKFASGRTHTVSYRLTAAGTVLLETWALAPGRETMTLYHLDGDNLIATHYCALGNQPTLELKPASDPSHFVFEFRSATNLPQPALSHQHRFEVRLLDADSFWRSETYLENGEGEPEAVTYRRVEQ